MKLVATVLLAVAAGSNGGVRHMQAFTLTCDPAGGTLPLAARVCADVARHRQAMLDPQPQRWVCAGGPTMPVLTVTTPTATFTGSPGCGWPGGTPISIYWAAATRDTHLLDLMEPRLRCEDDPVLLARPTPSASAVACVHGLWTPRAERLIRIAKQLVPGSRRFPSDPGAQRCGAALCGVSLTHVWSTPRVTFVERSAHRRQVWEVEISGPPTHRRPRMVHRTSAARAPR